MRIGCGDPVVSRILGYYEALSGVRLTWCGAGLCSRSAAIRAVRRALANGYRYDEFLGVMRQIEQQHGRGWPWSWVIARLPEYRAKSLQGCPYIFDGEGK